MTNMIIGDFADSLPMIRVGTVLLLYVLFPVLIIEIFKRKKWMQRLGTIIAAYIVGLLMAFTGVTHFPMDSMEEMVFSEWQDTMLSVSILVAIPLMLFNCDFRLWTKALPKTILALIAGVCAVVLAVLSGYLLFQDMQIPALGKVAAMLTGMYTGGTMNFNALGTSLDMNKSQMAMVLVFDMLLTVPLILSILTGGYRLMRRLLPYHDETTPEFRRQTKNMAIPVQEVEDYGNMFSQDYFVDVSKSVGLSGIFVAVGALLSYLLWKVGILAPNPDNPSQPVMSDLVIVLVITTLSIVASFFKKVRNWHKTFETGMFFILIFSVILASMFDWHQIQGNMLGIGLFIGWILVVSLLLHYLFCRLFKVSGDLYIVSMTALLCSPPFVPPVVAALGNRKVLISGIVIGLIGYSVGTYLGIFVAWLLHAL